ncbi:WD40 repeat domain-containing protein [Streptomyces calidiresistens]
MRSRDTRPPSGTSHSRLTARCWRASVRTRTIRLWETATRAPARSPLTGHTGGVDAVAFSPDGRFPASAGQDAAVRLWDPLSSRSPGAPSAGHRSAVRAVAFSPDSRLLATGGRDETARLWDTTDFRLIGAPLRGHSNAVGAVSFSSDGTLLARASTDRTVRLWNPADGLSLGHPLTATSAVSERQRSRPTSHYRRAPTAGPPCSGACRGDEHGSLSPR